MIRRPAPVAGTVTGTALLAALAIVAFAGNSLLTRAALGGGEIGAAGFAAIRLAAGAIALLPFLGARPGWGALPGAAALLAYAWTFSFAYLQLSAAVGALILFGSVQITIVGIGVAGGLRPDVRQLSGLLLAMAGLVWLLAPRLDAPPLGSALLMVAAGMAWGLYTLIGRRGGDPAGQTARSFLIAAPFALGGWMAQPGSITTAGALEAIVSGAVTSGAGYVVWYAVAPRLSLVTVAVAQLSTPVVAAIGAAILLGEPITARLGISAVCILAGTWLSSRRPAVPVPSPAATGAGERV